MYSILKRLIINQTHLVRASGKLVPQKMCYWTTTFFKFAQARAGEEPGNFLVFIYFLSIYSRALDHCGYCDPLKSNDFKFQDYNKILTIVSGEGEIVHLERPVRAEGSVEVWLMSLLTASQESVHCIIRQAFHFINDNQFDFLDFLGRFQAQVGL